MYCLLQILRHSHMCKHTQVIIPSSLQLSMQYRLSSYREFRLNEYTGVCSYFYAHPDKILIMNGIKKPGLLGGITFHKHALSP